MPRGISSGETSGLLEFCEIRGRPDPQNICRAKVQCLFNPPPPNGRDFPCDGALRAADWEQSGSPETTQLGQVTRVNLSTPASRPRRSCLPPGSYGFLAGCAGRQGEIWLMLCFFARGRASNLGSFGETLPGDVKTQQTAAVFGCHLARKW